MAVLHVQAVCSCCMPMSMLLAHVVQYVTFMLNVLEMEMKNWMQNETELGSKKKFKTSVSFSLGSKMKTLEAREVKEPKNQFVRSSLTSKSDPVFLFSLGSEKIKQNWCTLMLNTLQVIAYNLFHGLFSNALSE